MSDVTRVTGRDVLLKRPPMVLFGLFGDLSLLVQNVPEEYGGKITADRDSVHIEYKGVSLGFVVARREPFSLVELKDDGKSFLTFSVTFHMDPVGLDSTLFHIELSTELNFMMKMMIGSKLQEMVDRRPSTATPRAILLTSPTSSLPSASAEPVT